jgi:poly(3-hydroxybutyrate) depolymerase
MKKFTTLVGLCLAFFLLFSSLPAHLHAQNVRKHIFDFRGDSLHFLEYKPAGHDTPGNTRKYPLIIFLHGIGEKNNSSVGLSNLESQGLPRVIRDGNLMKFTWNGVTDTFIVLSPMCRYSRPDTPNIGIWPSDYINSMMQYATASLKIDTNRIYLTGLSFGGGGTFRYLSLGLMNAQKLAAAASVCPPYHYNLWDAPSPNFENNVRDANLPFRSYHAADDTTAPVGASRGAISRINGLNPPVKAILTEWPTGGHFIWDRVYDTNLNTGGYDGVITLYEWFLGQNKSLPVNTLPIARVGNDTTIYASSGIAILSGRTSTDADGTIVRYVWKKISGSAAGSIATPFGSDSSTTVSGLTTADVYKYELSVVDNRAGIARDTLTITVVNAPTGSGKALTMSSLGRITTADVTQLKNASMFTLEAQFKYDSTVSGYTTIMRKSTSLTDRIMLHIGPSNNAIYVMVGNGSNSYGYTAANAVSPGTWYHVAAVFDGTLTGDSNRLKLYINGVQQTLSFSGSIPASTSNTNTAVLMVGGEPSCCYLNGTIDEVRVWNTALSAGTITDWKNKLLGSCHPNIANLVVYWPLNNNANPAAATAGLGTAYTGTIINGSYVTSNQATDSSICNPGKALTISSLGRITTADVTQLKNASMFTLEAQFKYDSTVSGYTTIMRKSTSLTDRIMLHIGPSNNSIYVMVGNGSNSYGYTAANAVNPGTWYHVAAVFEGTLTGDSNRLKLYINGVQQTLSFSGTIPASTSNTNTAVLMVGGEPSCCYLNGTIDEVRVWNAALSAGTIADWKDKLLDSCHPNITNLVVYWPLNNNANPAGVTAGLGTAYTGTIINGSYVISNQVTDSSGCSGARSGLSPSLKKVEENKLFTGKIYPNPTEGLVQIELNAPVSKSVTVNVFDISGRYLYGNISSVVKGHNRISLNIASLPAGTYIIVVRDSSSILKKYKVFKR